MGRPIKVCRCCFYFEPDGHSWSDLYALGICTFCYIDTEAANDGCAFFMRINWVDKLENYQRG